MPTATLTRLHESVKSPNLKVDSEAGIIRDVKILGRESKNGRTYSQTALEQACRLYQNVKVNIDHPDHSNPNQERAFESGFGELRRCRVTDSGIYGDLHFARSHPKANLICEFAERFPRQFGLSHNASGELVQRDGEWVVESIEAVYSVDIVGCPATNAGLFESVGRGRRGRRYPRTISLREAERVMRRTGRSFPSTKLLVEAMHAGVLAPGSQIEIPPEAEEAFGDAAELSMEDNADSLALTFAPDKLQEVKATVIKQIAKKSTNGKQTAKDIQEVNDFIDNGIAMLERMFPEELGNQPQPNQVDANIPGGPGIPESFVNRLRGWTPSRNPEEFASRISKPPVVTAAESRQERIRESRLMEPRTRWTPAADSKEFASRLRKV